MRRKLSHQFKMKARSSGLQRPQYPPIKLWNQVWVEQVVVASVGLGLQGTVTGGASSNGHRPPRVLTAVARTGYKVSSGHHVPVVIIRHPLRHPP